MDNKVYVEERDQGYWVAGSRVSLESVIYAFREGLSPETIAVECFPTLTLEQVYGSIAFYLSNRTAVDAYLAKMEVEFEEFKHNNDDPEFSRKMNQFRRQLQIATP